MNGEHRESMKALLGQVRSCGRRVNADGMKVRFVVTTERADDVRAAKARGKAVTGDARRPASKIVLDALAPRMAKRRKEPVR